MNSSHFEAFKAEAGELLAEFEHGLLQLDAAPDNTKPIESIFRALHTLKGNSRFLDFDDVEKFAHAMEEAFELLRQGERPFTRELGNLALLGKDLLHDMIEAHGGSTAVEAARVENLLRLLSEINQEEHPSQIATATHDLAPQHDDSLPQHADDQTLSYIRISLNRLSEVSNAVEELAARNGLLLQRARLLGDSAFLAIAEELDRLIDRLRDGSTFNRLKPIGENFNKYQGMIADLARDLGKEVEFIAEGVETELDMATLEKLNDAIVHLLRNTVDHGIETPEVRIAAGKGRRGMVKMLAKRSGSTVDISLSDDGAGLNGEKLRNKAIERELITADSTLSREEIFHLIFLPGFSTAGTVTSISGRGTGMDVVKRTIDALHGEIEITSEEGRGTVFTLKLPFSSAVVEGILIKIADRPFMFPLQSVEEIVDLDASERSRQSRHGAIAIRGSLVPYFRLRELFDEPPCQASDNEKIVVCSVEGRKIGFVVDQVVGECHALVKNLGSYLKHVDLFSGVTISSEGSLAFILDLQAIIRNAERRC
ncbi:MAG: chemotaxis protein CheA [Candidatus Riflebacteria bacterium]|nr:chemotaxis protein CheA [Candidatus Riflebacteria bacterium]